MKTWLKHGFWNTAEHAITRIADAGTTLLLLWALTPEVFSKLALAQALVAPMLLFFLAPEAVIYRDLALWRAKGPENVYAKLCYFRIFSNLKGVAGIILALALASFVPGSSDWSVRFFSVVWAFGLALAPHLSGGDREFLRLDLKLRTLGAISLYQKVILLAGTAWVIHVSPENMMAYAVVSVFSSVSTMWVTRASVDGHFKAEKKQAPRYDFQEFKKLMLHSLGSFSIWQHLAGVIHNWVLTMDLFFLGVFKLPAREVGLYAAVLKLCNFSLAFPLALSNLFSVWLGGNSKGAETDSLERVKLFKLSGAMLAACIAQGFVLWFLSPWLLEWFSRGRWSGEEQLQMLEWLKAILIGASVFGASFLLSSWLVLRTSVRSLFFKVYLPWGVLGFLGYAIAVRYYGVAGAAQANIWVMSGHVGLLLIYYKKRVARA